MVVSGFDVAGARVTDVRVDVSALIALAEFPDATRGASPESSPAS
jgi:hypothetical protein